VCVCVCVHKGPFHPDLVLLLERPAEHTAAYIREAERTVLAGPLCHRSWRADQSDESTP
jgi:hypothetical protein